MKFIRHKGTASTIQKMQYIHILENKNTRNKKIQKTEKDSLKKQQYCRLLIKNVIIVTIIIFVYLEVVKRNSYKIQV